MAVGMWGAEPHGPLEAKLKKVLAIKWYFHSCGQHIEGHFNTTTTITSLATYPPNFLVDGLSQMEIAA
jgi:hypothetical protein